MSDSASGGASHDTSHHSQHHHTHHTHHHSHSSDDSSPWQPHHSSGGHLSSLDTLRRAARWETLALLVALIVLAAVFS
ncbi:MULTISPECIES: hypothetical protein [unclassified Streptomyces]|uniref:hypothetical protein n=1 Tax=unclassified Streptomyces TaxID=2593676 RepID=UPI00131A1608|nr:MULTISPECIES: hypothetical protein [unclassified Streptomyces]MYT29343.1 hypothetical protein [Streptomyces sp. SID8354]